ncbi:MAG: metal-dependent transcriptional regulator [Acidobacteria bacterium]|nr:metal-dependent transcriptional regulator [Acidobacteriota bacterium]
MRITISKENYLKAIAEAESEGQVVIAATLARWLNVSPPAVTMAIKRLKRDDCINVAEDGTITLAPSGRDIANRLLTRHHLIERMLTEIFGMEWYKVHEEAEALEHAVSADFEKKLMEKLGAGEECPHGNILGLDTPELRRERGWVSLDSMAENREGRVASVFERDRQLLEFLDGLGIRPGSSLRMLHKNYDQTLTLEVGSRQVQIGQAAARRVWIAPIDGE